MELGLSLLSQASMPLSHWDHAFLTVVYLINRLPTKVLNFVVPYELLHGKQPDYSFLRISGCACFPLLRPYNNHKMDFKTKECTFLGYSPNHKGHKCLSPEGRIYISKDVMFNEHKFPFAVSEPASSSQPSNFPTPPSLSIPILPSQFSSSPISQPIDSDQPNVDLINSVGDDQPFDHSAGSNDDDHSAARSSSQTTNVAHDTHDSSNHSSSSSLREADSSHSP